MVHLSNPKATRQGARFLSDDSGNIRTVLANEIGRYICMPIKEYKTPTVKGFMFHLIGLVVF